MRRDGTRWTGPGIWPELDRFFVREISAQDIQKVTCPLCGSATGSRCRDPNGHKRAPHAPRRDIYLTKR